MLKCMDVMTDFFECWRQPVRKNGPSKNSQRIDCATHGLLPTGAGFT